MNTLLIGGLGKMGNNHARTALGLKDEFSLATVIGADTDIEKCQTLKETYPEMMVYHIAPDVSFQSANGHSIGTAPNMASIVAHHKANFFVGTTQTDSHLTVLSDALSATGENKKPLITNILQEKPFGIFDDADNDMTRLLDTIASNDIRFSLNSILMFSDIWRHADEYLEQHGDLQKVKSVCVYGKDRTKDTRPAHEGVFGTEGTHAIDILRGRGKLKTNLQISKSEITQGPIGQEKDTPYTCLASGIIGGNLTPFDLEMSLAFDRNYRAVDHHFVNARTDNIVMRLAFDVNGTDTLTVWNKKNGEVLKRQATDASTKLANSMRASFGTVPTQFTPYDTHQTAQLRQILKRLKNADSVQITKSAPAPARPRFA